MRTPKQQFANTESEISVNRVFTAFL